MAIINEGINGGFSGKVGRVVGYWLNGQWVMRGVGVRRNKLKTTDGEKRARGSFAQVQAFLKPLLPVLKIGFDPVGQ